MSESSFSHTLAERGFTRFVLLRPRGAACPSGLADALRERWHQVTQVYDPLNALAELCLLDRAEQPRRDWGLEARDKIALIFFEQDAWESLNKLLEIVKARLPAISVWNCTNGLALEISKAQVQPPRRPQSARDTNDPNAEGPPRGRKEYGTLRLTGSFPEAPEEKPTKKEAPENPPQTAPTDSTNPESEANPDSVEPKQSDLPTVSPEELELLLGLLEDEDESSKPPERPSEGEQGLGRPEEDPHQ